jgi:hypothetical protein
LEDVVPIKVRSRLSVWYYCAAHRSKPAYTSSTLSHRSNLPRNLSAPMTSQTFPTLNIPTW